MNEKTKCPMCESDMDKVIYAGLPGKFCQNRECNCLMGLASYAPSIEDHEGRGFCFMIYEGNYLKALWYWLFGGEEDE